MHVDRDTGDVVFSVVMWQIQHNFLFSQCDDKTKKDKRKKKKRMNFDKAFLQSTTTTRYILNTSKNM